MTVFTPEMMAKLASQAQYIVPAAKAVSQFAKFPGPNGKWYAAWNRLTAKWNQKDGCLVVSFAFTSLAFVETQSQDYAGYPMIIRFYLRASANQTVQQAWDRLYTDGYQAMGINTQAWKPEEVMAEMAKASDWLNEQKLPVIITVSDNKNNPQFRNFNIAEVLTPAAVKRYSQPSMHISEDEINDSADLSMIEEGDDFQKSFDEGRAYLATMDRTDLLNQAAASEIEILHPSTITIPTLCDVLMRNLCISAGKDPADYGLGEDPQMSAAVDGKSAGSLGHTNGQVTDGTSGAGGTGSASAGGDSPGALERTGTINKAPFDHVRADLSVALQEVDEEDDEPANLPSIETTAKATAMIMDRNTLKLAILKYNPSAKFMKSMSDDVIRDMLIEAAVAADDIRF